MDDGGFAQWRAAAAPKRLLANNPHRSLPAHPGSVAGCCQVCQPGDRRVSRTRLPPPRRCFPVLLAQMYPFVIVLGPVAAWSLYLCHRYSIALWVSLVPFANLLFSLRFAQGERGAERLVPGLRSATGEPGTRDGSPFGGPLSAALN